MKQLLGMLHGEHAQEHGVDGGKERGVGADADGEDEHGENREHGILPVLAEGVMDVAEEFVEPAQSAGFAALFAVMLNCAKFESSLTGAVGGRHAPGHEVGGTGG